MGAWENETPDEAALAGYGSFGQNNGGPIAPSPGYGSDVVMAWKPAGDGKAVEVLNPNTDISYIVGTKKDQAPIVFHLNKTMVAIGLTIGTIGFFYGVKCAWDKRKKKK